jgi:hypothetical protein
MSSYAERMAFNVPSEVEQQLIGGERILWTGQPDPGRHFDRSDRFLIPFSILWGGFAIFWEAAVIQDGWGFGVVWGIPFVAMGLYFIFGRFFVKARKKRRTHYAVTDRRVLSVERGGPTRATFLDLIPTINATVRNDGSGTAIFGNTSWMQNSYANTGLDFFGRGYDTEAVGFYDIRDARQVVDLVNTLRDRASDRQDDR